MKVHLSASGAMKRLIFLSVFQLSLVLHILNLSPTVYSECNVCNAKTNTSCYSKTEFQQCKNNEPYGSIYPCNENSYCTILGSCMESEELADCNSCGKCDANKVFACTGTQTFALCLGKEEYSEMTGQCAENFTCNINDDKICGNESSTCSERDDPTPEPTTTTTTTTTSTTPSPVQDPNGFCQLIQKEGRFPLGTDAQTTCRQYVSCVKVGSTWYGPIYNCPGQTYFDSSKNACVANRPSTCSATVTGLAFRNILLE